MLQLQTSKKKTLNDGDAIKYFGVLLTGEILVIIHNKYILIIILVVFSLSFSYQKHSGVKSRTFLIKLNFPTMTLKTFPLTIKTSIVSLHL